MRLPHGNDKRTTALQSAFGRLCRTPERIACGPFWSGVRSKGSNLRKPNHEGNTHRRSLCITPERKNSIGAEETHPGLLYIMFSRKKILTRHGVIQAIAP